MGDPTINAQYSQGFVNNPSGPVSQTFNINEAGYTLPSPHQIPTPPADFVGRAKELDALCQAVEHGGAIITGIQGLGGIGKTALAYKLAEALKDRYPDGSLMLDLHGPDAPIPPEMILDRFIHAFYPTAKLPEDLPSLQSLYHQVLTGKRLILLLDNARGLEQISPLLPPPEGCLAFVTSRIHFTCAGMQDLNLEVLPEADAVKLLLEIAPHIGQEEAKTLAKACGYLPLALRVVASQMKVKTNLTAQDWLKRMADETKRLKLSGAEPALEVSYQMLAPEQQAQWRKLSVFAGDFELEAVAWVWGIITEETTSEQDEAASEAAQDALADLLTYSLVEYKDKRYHLHDLARIYAGKKMRQEEAYIARLAHANYYLDYLNWCDDHYLQGGTNVMEALALFDQEVGEISAAQHWCAAGETQDIDLLCSQFPNFGTNVLNLRLHPLEQSCWLRAGLCAAKRLGDTRVEGTLLNSLGLAYYNLGDARQAIEYYEQALVILPETGDHRAEGTLLNNLGTAYAALGDARRAIEYYEQALVILHETGDRRTEGTALNNLGLAYYNLGDVRRAIEYYEQALVILRETGDRRMEGTALNNLGMAYYNLGDVRRAIENYEQALVILREIGDRRTEGTLLNNLGTVHAALGDARRAIEYYEQALVIQHETGDRRMEGTALNNLGLAYYNLGDVRRAIEYYEQALVILRETGDRHGEGTALNNLGMAYYNLGDVRRAIENYEQALVVQHETGDRYIEGIVLANLGMAYNNLGDVRRAIEYYKQALVILRETGDRHTEVIVLANLGKAYTNLVGDVQRAIGYYEQALVISCEIGDRRGEAIYSWNLGDIYINQGELLKAVALKQVYVDYLREIGNPDAEKFAAHVADLRTQIPPSDDPFS